MATALRSRRMSPQERKAVSNEFLDQQYQFRLNMARMHGLPMPAGPHYVDEVPADQDSASTKKLVESAEKLAKSSEKVVEALSQPADTSTADAVRDVGDKLADTAPQVVPVMPVQGSGGGTGSFLAKAALGAALIASGASIPFLGGLGAYFAGQPSNPPAVEQPADNPGDIRDQLRDLGYDVHPTDLGEDILRAFEMNPALREQLLEDVRRTLEDRDAG